MPSINVISIKLIPLLLCLTGAGITLYSIAEYCSGSIPFQDAPYQLLLQQQMELNAATDRIYFGIAAFSAGILISFIQLFINRKFKKKA